MYFHRQIQCERIGIPEIKNQSSISTAFVKSPYIGFMQLTNYIMSYMYVNVLTTYAGSY